jgi:hypothetical protein
MFTFFIIWLSLQQVSKIVSTISLIVIIGYSINIRIIQNKYLLGLDADIIEVCEFKNYIEPNSVYYPINFNPNWIKVHFLNYVGVENPFVSAQLPNCSGTFPIIDTKKDLPVVMLGDTDLSKLCYWCSNWDKSKPQKYVDYIIIDGAKILSSSNEHATIRDILQNNYDLVQTSSKRNFELYKLKGKYLN